MIKDNTIILASNQNKDTELWDIPIPGMAQEVSPTYKVNNILANQKQPEMATYYNAAMWSLTEVI